ncbi:MAG: site-specific integrase [Alphaproteobacteria bacterium]|nr:site-specific integrase [Alphaproteobacteria bacterium]
MATQTYLMRRNGIYYARIPVPTGMQEEVGRKEIWKSLGNRNYKESCKLLKTVLLSDALFMIPNNEKIEVLNNKAAMVAIGERQRELSRHRLCHVYLNAHQGSNKVGLQERAEEDANLFAEDARRDLRTYDEDIKATNFQPYEVTLATRLQTTKFLSPERGSIHYNAAMTQLLRGLIKGTEEAIKAIEDGSYVDFINGDTTPYPATMLAPQNRVESHGHSEGSPSTPVISLKQLTDMFNNSLEIRRKSQDLKIKYATYQAFLIDALGEATDIHAINRPMVREKLLPILDHLPANFQKKPEYKAMSSIQVALAEQKNPSHHPKLSPASRNDYLEHLALLMKWAAGEDYDVSNPTTGLMFKDDVKAKDKRDSFTTDQINLILGDKKFLAAKLTPTKAHQFWVPFISLCTGMRISEVVLLALDDIKQEKGIFYFDLREREGRSLKTITSIRKVPIPETLLRLGFLEYVHALRGESIAHNRLFPYIVLGKKRPGDPLSKWFSRKLGALGIKSKTLSFHSLRHTFKDFITDAVLPPQERQVALSMLGWESNEVHARYGSKDYSIAVGKEVIDKIELAGVELPLVFLAK